MVSVQEVISYVTNRKYVVPTAVAAYAVACVIALVETRADASAFGVQSRVCMAVALCAAAFAVAVRSWGVHHLGVAQQMVQTYADRDARDALTRATGGRGPALITTGPYAHTRNPLYLGVWLLNLSLGLALRPAAFVFLVVFFTVRWSVVVRDEERDVRATFGAPHAAYAERVNAFVPYPHQCVALASAMQRDATVPWRTMAVARELRWALWYVVAYGLALALAVANGGGGSSVWPLLVVLSGSALALTFLWFDVFVVHFVKPKSAAPAPAPAAAATPADGGAQ